VGNGSTWVAESGNTALASLGVTATATELNILDGITASTAELNILDGVTATAAEINKLDGVTWSLANYNSLTATAAELNKLDGATVTTAELNELDGVSSIGGDLVRAADAAAQRTVLGLGDLAVLDTVDTAQIASGEQMTTTNVNTAIASSTVGGVGTYAFLGSSAALVVAYGGTTAGSGLDYRGVTDNGFDTNQAQVPGNGVNPAGTWRAMGILAPYNGAGYPSATLFLRIA
jgi:hypothetical protein